MAPPSVALEVRLWEKVEITGFCWLWTGSTTSRGYGWIRTHGREAQSVHRLAYELLIGPIPAGLQVDHLCRIRNCVNPDHLELVTGRENTLRGHGVTAANARKTHCPRGHAYDEANTHIGTWGRFCRTCRRERDHANA